VQQQQQDMAMCEAEYAAEVEDRWMFTDHPVWALTGSDLITQRNAFVQCANGAGMKIPLDSTDSKITAITSDADVFNHLTPAQQNAESQCVWKYQKYLATVTPPG
jgi:hypothetical protein